MDEWKEGRGAKQGFEFDNRSRVTLIRTTTLEEVSRPKRSLLVKGGVQGKMSTTK